MLHTLIHNNIDNCKLLLYVWYLDDETIIRDLKEVVKALDNIIWEAGPGLDIELNICNKKIIWASWDDNKLRQRLFYSDIGMLVLAIKLL